MNSIGSSPRILQIGTSVPAHSYSQAEILAELGTIGFAQDRRTRVIFGRAGVKQRHTAIEASFYVEPKSTEARNDSYLEAALPLGEAAICHSLDKAGIPPDAIDEFIVVSCTGFDIPGLDLRLAGRLGMRPDLRRMCVLGMGCYGAFPALLRAYQSTMLEKNRLVMVLALELCSVHFQMEDTLENIVSAALFADGAATALIGSTDSQSAHAPYFINSATYCDYQTIDHMAFHVTDQGFHMQLSAYVPDLLAANIESFVDQFLVQNDLCREDVRLWGIHPGSSKILDYVQSRLGLSGEQMLPSRTILRDYGNMSSATILFVLDEIQRSADPRAGDYGILLGFGPGLTSEVVLLRW